MAIYHITNAEIYPYYEKMIDYLIEQRNNVKDEDLVKAINLQIILSCACRIEGVLEKQVKSIVHYYQEIYRKVEIPEFEIRKPTNVFFNAVFDDLNKRNSQCIGISKYDDFCILLLQKSFKADTSISPYIEDIQTLFQLRNVIAHGREISAHEKLSRIEEQEGEEYFFGGYKKAETLLLKKGIIKERFVKTESAGLFFVNEVADYFLIATNSFIIALETFIRDNLRVDDFLNDLVNDFNKKNRTEFTVENFLENVSVEVIYPE